MKKFKKREISLVYSGDTYPIQDILQYSSFKKCPWFIGLQTYIGGSTIIYDTIRKVHQYLFRNKNLLAESGYRGAEEIGGLDTVGTARTCPAVREQIRDSILVLMPCDLVLSYDAAEDLLIDTPSGENKVTVGVHPRDQVTMSSSPLKHFKDKIFIKYELPILIGVAPSVPFILMDPIFHNHPPGTVVSGIMPSRDPSLKPLNIIVAMDLPPVGSTTTVVIKKGTVLAYIWADGNITITDAKTRGLKGYLRSKFIGEK
jgi:hypothetical protein